MNKEEILKELDNIAVEMRSLMEAVKDESKPFNADEVNAKRADLESRKAKLEKELAEFNRPNDKEEKRTLWGDMVKGIKENRSTITVNGTGAVNTVRGLVKAVTDKIDILNRANFFYGPAAQTAIPVWPSHAAATFVAEGGTAATQTKNIGVTQIYPKQALSSLVVSQMALDLSAADLESEMPDIMANAFGPLMASEMLTGDGTNMQGIFTDSKITKYEKSLTIANLAALALTVKSKNYINPCIIMSSSVYGAFMADNPNPADESTKIYKESLIRGKEIEGVPVVITSYAPDSTSTGAIVAVAGDLENYAIAVGGELKIKAKDTAGSSVVTYDGYSYFSGKPIISADFIGYKVAA